MNIFHKVTLKTLKENRTRTLVTIIGIILSTAMFTAVTTSISSLRHCMIEYAKFNTGTWHGAGYDLSADSNEKLRTDPQITASTSMECLGFSLLEDFANKYKPYLCVYGINDDFTELLPVHLTQGRMPQNSNEILLSETVQTNACMDWNLNDSLTLELGTRTDWMGNLLSNQNAFLTEDDAKSANTDDSKSDTTADLDSDSISVGAENFHPAETRTYTIVGFFERPFFEGSASYTALTTSEGSTDHTYDLYIQTNAKSKTDSTINNIFDSHAGTWRLNYNLLRLYGYSGESPYNTVLTNLGIILGIIITLGSISLIYNAFSISVSERTRQFGLLSSIGATKRQLTGSILFEAFFLCIIAIPLGILSGLAGIGITFLSVQDMMASVLGITNSSSYTAERIAMLLGPSKGTSLGLHPSLPAIATAAAISLLTVLISAYIPAKRATKKSAIDAIRQANDISIRPRKVKTSRLTQKLFGFEGMIATKNYKRNRRKYRTTVISLFLSIVLFISASSFCAYLTLSVGSVLGKNNYDLIYTVEPDTNSSAEELIAELSKADSVTASSYAISEYFTTLINTANVSPEMQAYIQKEAAFYGDYLTDNDKTEFSIHVTFLADRDFRAYLKQLNLPEETFFNPEAPTAVIMDSLKLYSETEKKYHRFHALADASKAEITLYLTRMRENYSYNGICTDESGNICSRFYLGDSDEPLLVPIEDSGLEIPLTIGAAADQAPEFYSDEYGQLRLFYPYSMIDHVFSSLEPDVEYFESPEYPASEHYYTELFFQCEDHNAAAASMTKILTEKGLAVSRLIDYAASFETERAMITVINIFSFGFITLISLIAAANVFNTISTNLNLRRREFAMLKSIGMTPRAFSKMMNFECLLYGFKGLLYGLPVSFFITWLIYRAIGNGLETAFFIPWYSIAIAVLSVFLVVFATMLYSMHKIHKENTIDALKNENI